jgi:Flp pilus assembly protein TadD
LEQAIRLSPRDPNIGAWYNRIGLVHLARSRIGEAILWFEKAHSTNPASSSAHAYLAASYALNGESNRAAAELAEARGSTATVGIPALRGWVIRQ